MDIQEKKMKHRFLDDYPISIVQEPYFTDRLIYLNREFGCYDEWKEFNKMLNEHFEGNHEKFLEHYAEVRNKMIEDLQNNESIIRFRNEELPKPGFVLSSIKNRLKNIYTHEQNGKMFLSIDMSKANFTALRHYDPNIFDGAKTYYDWVSKYTDIEFIKNTRHTRQVVFGQVKPDRQLKYEQYLMETIYKDLFSENEEFLSIFELVDVKSDELIFIVKDEDKAIHYNVEPYINKIISNYDLNVKYELFRVKEYVFKRFYSDVLIRVYGKVKVGETSPYTLKCVPAQYYIQISKLINKEEVTNDDLVFYNDHELGTFFKPLELIEEN